MAVINNLGGSVNFNGLDNALARMGEALGVYQLFSVTNNLTNCASTNAGVNAGEFSSYNATIVANSGYSLTGASVSITMGGVDITASAYNNGTISIASVAGDIVISISTVVAPSPYLTFSSPNSFTLAVYNSTKNWDGTIETSTDTSTWNTWDGTSAVSSASDGVKHNIYVRGIGNTIITGSSLYGYLYSWIPNGTSIAISGNIENLLDYSTVANNQHPPMASYAFSGLFYSSSPNGNITDISSLILGAETLAPYCYYGMFVRCAGLTTLPSDLLPATTLQSYCYWFMFEYCTGLTTLPSDLLPATTLASNCYYSMFYGCTNLTTLPKLPATTLQSYCYHSMFYNCTKIKLSTTQTVEYVNEFRIPYGTATGTVAGSALIDMFANTGGTMQGTPAINTTYYTSNQVV